MADKRKAQDKTKTPAKKRKIETPKSSAKKLKATPAKKKTPTPKKVTSSKITKSTQKKTPAKTPAKSAKTPAKSAKTPAKSAKTPAKSAKTPAKSTKTPAKSTKTPVKKTKTPVAKPNKSPVKKKPSTKTPAKAKAKSPAKKVSPTKKLVKPATKKTPTIKKNVNKPKLAATSVTRAKVDKAKIAAMKAKVEKAKALKAKATAAKSQAKLKTTKTAAKLVKKALVKPKVPLKKPQPKMQEEKKAKALKAALPEKKEEKDLDQAAPKRKTEIESESSEPSRKRRMITPNKKFADFELDVPAKRIVTPNKKYADFETDTSPKNVSELRAFIQDKKKTPSATEITEEQATTAKKEDSKETPGREIKVFKASEMKPAEKLMKKLQKKLEKEAKAGATPKPTENREKAKIKITKVVTYDKPMSSDEKEMRSIARKTTPKAKATVVKAKEQEAGFKTPKTPAVKPTVAKATPKTTPKAAPKPGKVPEKAAPKPKKIRELKREERPIQAKFSCQKNIKLPDDNEKVSCWITGIGVFPSGEIIMVDMANRKIKLFSKEFEFLSQVKLDTIPQDISVSPVNASDAYFTKPFSKEGIQKISMSDGKLTLKESFWTNGTNRGITCTKSGILTSVQDGRYHDLDINHFKIDLLDYEGKVLQSVSTDSNGSRLFKLPLYFTVDSTSKQVIVADCIKHLSYIVSVDMSGKIKFKYEGVNHNLVTPRGLTIDDEDNIYVTEWERHNVYILSPAGKRLQVLFSHQELVEEGLDGLQKPYQLCFYKQDDAKKLIVSQEGCNTIKVFTVSKKPPETEANKQAEATVVTEKQPNLPNGEASATDKAPETQKKTTSPTKAPAAVKAIPEKKVVAVKKVAEKPAVVAIQKKEVKTIEKPQTVTIISKKQVISSVVPSTSATSAVVQTTLDETVVSESKSTKEESNSSPPTLEAEAEFAEDFGAVENKVEDNTAVDDAINSLNDSEENQVTNENTASEEAPDDSDQIQVQVYEQINDPNTQIIQIHSEEIAESSDPHIVQVPVENFQIGMTYEQQIGIQQHVEEIVTQPMETDIQSVPIETMGGEAILMQQTFNQVIPDQYQKVETVNVNNNEATNYIPATETVQYMSEDYSNDIAQEGEIITEMSEEVVAMETV